MKKNKKEKKPYVKTRTRLDGGKEIEVTESPSKTHLGKFFAVLIAALTLLVPLIALIVVLVQNA